MASAAANASLQCAPLTRQRTGARSLPNTHGTKQRCRAARGATAGPPPAAAPSWGRPSGPRPLDHKVALITGANTGIGFETAKALRQRDYQVVLACRDKEKAEAARRKLKELVPGARSVEVAIMDLADLSSVRDWAKRAQDFSEPLDVLICNAGVMACPQQQTKDGFEYQLGVNHLGHFLLANMVTPLLTTPERPSRVVTVSSAAHFFGHINFEDLQFRTGYNPWKAYGQSKLANVLMTYEMARRLSPNDNCTANCLHPGVVATELVRYLLPERESWWQQPLAKINRAFSLTAEQGAQTSVYLAASPEVEGVSGKYYDKCKPVSSSKESYDAAVAARLWDVSAELVGL
ncbi:hypothetical protein D9Q98_002327 [Chlorella vulgaris]|uniref:Uncharacterized protein n=1 Tax=Chlorella vulgaris TaxID=3077 RepID=A0A9D4Z059_CHLVU|nr:hypothetical protein D9Q98_002327 [Chlorella vulgaris]